MSDLVAAPANGLVMGASGAAAVPERRDPAAATTPVKFITPGMATIPEWDASNAFTNGYDASVWVMRCVEIIASTIAAMPFRAGLDLDNRTDHDPTAPLARLLGPPPRGPAPKLSARRWWKWQITQYLVTGRFAAEVERAGGYDVAALWPLPAATVRPIPTKAGTEWFAGFEVGPPGGASPKRFPADRVLYVWRPAGHDFREPESPLKAARLPVSVSVMLGRYSYSFLKNDARPAQVVITQPFAEQDDYDAFKAQFIAEFGGPDQAGKTAFVEANEDGTPVEGQVDIKQTGLTQKDAQMLESGQAAALEICAALGVPMSLLDASGRTYNNADAERLTFLRNTVLPLATELEDAINLQFAPMVGREVGWFDTTTIPELQPKPRWDAAQAVELVNNRIVTPNEGRAELGLAPAAGGDRFVDPPAPVDPMAGRAPTVVVNTAAAGEQVDARARGGARTWSKLDARTRLVEQSWVGTLQGLFEKQRKVTLDRVTNGGKYSKRVQAAVDAGAIDESRAGGDFGIFDQAYWRAETSKVAEDLFRRAMALGLDRVTDTLGVSFDLSDPWAVDFILGRANQLAGHTTAVTYSKIQAALSEGVSGGESIPDIAARIEAVFTEAKGPRAELIARTEVISASNGSVERAAISLPEDVVGGKQWIAAQDERTRDSHAALDGQIVGRNATFDVGGSAMRYPGDPAGDPAEAINCRCAMALVTPEEMP